MVPVCFCRWWGRKEVFILIVLFVVIKQAYCCFRFRFWLCFNFRQLWLNSRSSKQPSSLFLIFITEQTSPWFWLAWLGGRGRLCFNCRFLGWWSHFGLTQEASVILLEARKKECSRILPFKVPITKFFYFVIQIYISSNDVSRRNFLIPSKSDFLMIFLKSLKS